MSPARWYEIHEAFAWVTVIANGVVGVWALGAHYVTALRGKALTIALVAAFTTVFVQVVLGVIVLNQGYQAAQYHEFYGFIAIASIGIIYSYRNQLAGKTYLLFGGGALFVMGLCIRAMVLHL